jgi:hypothetical protein
MTQNPGLQSVQVDEAGGHGAGGAIGKPVQGVGDFPDEDNFRDLRPVRDTRLGASETESFPHDAGNRNVAGKIP